MSLELSNVTALAGPQAWLAGKGAQLALRLVALVAALLLLWYVVDRLLIAPGRHKAEVARLATTVKASQAVTETAKDATATGTEIQIVRDRIERITRENTTRILAAPGANGAVPAAVDDAFMASLCLRHVYHDDPACNAVPGPAAGDGDGSNTGGSNPAG